MKRSLAIFVVLTALVSVMPRARAQDPARRFTTGTASELAVARSIGLERLRATAAQRGIVQPEDLVVSRVNVDESSMAHTRVQQYFRGVPVFGGEAIVHLRADAQVFAETDNLVSNINVDTTPQLTAARAIANAVAEYGCSDCLTAPSTTGLWVLRRDGVDHLVYRVRVERLDGTAETAMPVFFVDAHDGDVVWGYNDLKTGSGISLYSGTVSFGTYNHMGTWVTENPTRRVGTYDMRNGVNDIFDFQDANDFWDGASQRAGVDAAWGAERYLDYLSTQHGRSGIDGSGGPGFITSWAGPTVITSLVHYGSQYNNAAWVTTSTGQHFMIYGDGDGSLFSPLVSLDVVAHEFTHGVTQYTANLTGGGEVGALNESMSDVFGAMTERHVKGESANTWMIGENIYRPGVSGDALRYLDDPHRADNLGFTANDDPDHYSERYTGSADDGGVHVNAGIPNKAFYLVAKGGSHHLGGTMTGIGADQAARIWYRALTSFMTSSTNFAGARTATVNAASALYGSTSVQVATVSAAWCLVGVGTCATPAANSVSPASGSGASQTFTLQYTNADGNWNINTAWAWFTPTFAGPFNNSCFLYYNRSTNQMNLLNNGASGYATGTIGSGSIANGQCSINLAAASAVGSGTTLTLALPITFTAAAFNGTKHIFMDAVAYTGASSGWPDRGTWTIPGQALPTVGAVSVTPNAGSGSSQSFAFLFSDTAGASDLSTAWIWFTPAFSMDPVAFQNSCFINIQRATNTVNLLTSAGTAYVSGSVGANTTLSNGRCSIALGGSSVAPSGNNLTLNLSMSFAAAFAGAKQVWLEGVSAQGPDSGWQNRGTFTVTGTAHTVAAVSVTPNTGSGTNQTFSLLYSDNAGAADIASAWVWFTPTFATTPGAFTNTCFLYYHRATNTLNLLNNTATGYASGTVGGSGSISNSQCLVSLTPSTATQSGDNLTLSLAMAFAPPNFQGAKNVYMDVVANDGINAGWPDRGDWTVPAPSGPTLNTSVTPNAGSGASQTFALVYTDMAGTADIDTAWTWISASNANGAWLNSCFVYYRRSTNTLNLLNNAGTAYTSGTLGSGTTLQNSQCSIALGSSSTSSGASSLTVNLAITFAGAFAGAKNIYMDVVNNAGTSAGWADRGDWTVPPGGGSLSAVSVTPNSGIGLSQTFQFLYQDPAGVADMATTWIWFGPAAFTTTPSAFLNTCFMYYHRATNTLNLLNNAASGYTSGTVGSGGTLSNGQCAINVGSSSVTPSGTQLTLNLAMTFTSGAFSGTKNIFMDVVTNGGASAGWADRGDWTVP